MEIEITHLFISSGHRFAGRHGKGPADFSMEAKEAIDCVAGQGIVGDRYFGFKENYKGQLTFFSLEVYSRLCERFDERDKGPDVFRRNVLVSGIDLNDLIGKRFAIGDLSMEGVEEARPCYWMNSAFCEGAEAALMGCGGLRVRLSTDGALSLGSHQLELES